MPPPFAQLQSFTADGPGVVTRVWDTTANGFPTGWETAAFDDSGWAIGLTVPGYPIFRTHVTVPLTPWQPYHFNCASFIGSVYLNGHQVIGAGVASILSVDYPTPGSDYVIIEAGEYAWGLTFFLPDAGGQPYAWGTVTPTVNDKGFLGVGDTATHLTPTIVDLTGGMPATIVKVVSNGKTTLFLTNQGAVWGCGDNSTGLLGQGTTDTLAHPTPIPIPLNTWWPAIDISIGQDCALVATRVNSFVGWGPNAYGSLDAPWVAPPGFIPFVPRLSPGPVDVANQPATVTCVSAGKNFSIRVYTISGLATCEARGDNTYGQLGIGSTGGAGSGNEFNLSGPASQVSAGDDQTLIRLEDGTVLVCGRAEYGSLGHAAYAAGTGPNKIVSTPIVSLGGDRQVEQAGPLSFTLIDDLAQTTVNGYGTPYGGAGDNAFDGLTIHAESWRPYGSFYGSGRVFSPIDDSDFWPLDGLASTSGGSNNPFTGGITLCDSVDSGVQSVPMGPSEVILIALRAIQTNGKFMRWTFQAGTAAGTTIIGIRWYNASSVLLLDVPLVALGSDQFTEGELLISEAPVGSTQFRFYATGNTSPPPSAQVTVDQYCNTGTSQAVFAAFGFTGPPTYTVSDGLLYTWGWGGAGQMGSGSDPITNVGPISINGLSDVIGAAVCAGAMFAISAVATPVVAVRGRRFAAILG